MLSNAAGVFTAVSTSTLVQCQSSPCLSRATHSHGAFSTRHTVFRHSSEVLTTHSIKADDNKRSRRYCVVTTAVIVALLVVGGVLTLGIWLSANENSSGTYVYTRSIPTCIDRVCL